MSHYAFNWFALPPLVTALCSLLTGLMLYRREWTSRVGQALMGVTFAIAFWFVASGMLYLSVDESTALLWAPPSSSTPRPILRESGGSSRPRLRRR